MALPSACILTLLLLHMYMCTVPRIDLPSAARMFLWSLDALIHVGGVDCDGQIRHDDLAEAVAAFREALAAGAAFVEGALPGQAEALQEAVRECLEAAQQLAHALEEGIWSDPEAAPAEAVEELQQLLDRVDELKARRAAQSPCPPRIPTRIPWRRRALTLLLGGSFAEMSPYIADSTNGRYNRLCRLAIFPY